MPGADDVIVAAMPGDMPESGVCADIGSADKAALEKVHGKVGRSISRTDNLSLSYPGHLGIWFGITTALNYHTLPL
jgi:hypothetical protein